MPWIIAAVAIILIGGAIAAAIVRTRRSGVVAPVVTPHVTATAPARPAAASVEVAAPPSQTIATTTEPAQQPPAGTSTTAASTQPPPLTESAAPVASQDENLTVPERTADDEYKAGMARLLAGDWRGSRASFRRAAEKDPHHAKAHFRLGELALMGRNFLIAQGEFGDALRDAGRLDAREQALSRFGLAVATRNRPEAQAIAAEINERWPGDPDLLRLEAEFARPMPRPRRRQF